MDVLDLFTIIIDDYNDGETTSEIFDTVIGEFV